MLLTIPEACQAMKIGRTRLYALINAGQINARKNGKRTLIEKSEIERWASTLPAYNAEA